MRIIAYQRADIHQIVLLFQETVHAIQARDYSMEQLEAWAPSQGIAAKIENWHVSLSKNITFVAEIKGKLVGFGDMNHRGYLDRLYTHKDFQRQRIATALVSKLENAAINLGIQEINTEASITAKPFFEHRGFHVVEAQKIERNGIVLSNYKMVKKLPMVLA
ncbi:GNAT family N-acetyltransferase [Ornithinibacillus gellani]|uniref:GNAT family N-acetyltransferase n=1 Tax=Ornithinibacillus gellani TaxID=2293253 RepID=UPI000F4A6D0E|nr:GNAT family N-acetyltransferase [Ornithinibacillus gellani]TQS76520.1 GNAT family N-acetyltransferase [Ornithinibacillus gellani]